MTTFEHIRHILRRRARALAPAVLAGLLMGGCSEPEANIDPERPTPVTLNADIRTRAPHDDGRWSPNDLVGLFMVPAGNIVYWAVPGGNNRIFEFEDTDAGKLVLRGGGEIYYPGSEKVDFIAYHYGGGSLNNNNKISLENMHMLNRDLLYAKVENVDRTSGPVNLAFRQMLGKVRVNVIKGAGMESDNFRFMKATVSGMPGSARVDFDKGALVELADPADIGLSATTAGQGFAATLEATVFPQEAGQFPGRTISFESQSMTRRTWNIPDENDIPAGMVRVYDLTFTATEIVCSSYVIRDWKTPVDHGSGDASVIGEGIEKVRIPAAGKTFLMGSSDGSNIGDKDGSGLNTTPAEPHRFDDETQHRVKLTSDYYMSKYPITNAQYAEFLNTKGVQYETEISNDKISGNGGKCTWGENDGQIMVLTHKWGVAFDAGAWKASAGYENHPVVNVTWYGAAEYAKWIGGALPTEAQWEFACRGGQTGSLPFGIGDGTKLTYGMANFFVKYSYQLPDGEFEDQANFEAHYKGETSAVGSYPHANGYGLYDMHGNVMEWCSDWADENYYSDPSAGTDPVGPAAGKYRVLRGGSWGDGGYLCRSALRAAGFPEDTYIYYGFRVVFAL